MSLFRTGDDDDRQTFDPSRSEHWQRARIASLEQEIAELRLLLAEADIKLAGYRWRPSPDGRVVRLSALPRPIPRLVIDHG